MNWDFPGLSHITEIGRGRDVIGYSARRQGRELILELLREDSLEIDWFFRSAALQSRLGHPSIPVYLESGFWQGRPYRLREYVRGRPVLALLGDGPLPEERVVAALRTVAAGLLALHRLGYRHGDIELNHLRVDRSGVFRFLDSGFCYPPGRGQASELIRFQDPDPSLDNQASYSSDMYAFGRCILDLALGYRVAHDQVEVALQELSLRPSVRQIIRWLVGPIAQRPSAAGVLEALLNLEEWDALLWIGKELPAVERGEPKSRPHGYPLLGRDQELSHLVGLWHSGNSQVALVGPPGAGRSRLAEELRRASSSLEVVALEQPPTEAMPWLELKPLPSQAALQLTEAFLHGPMPRTLAEVVQAQNWWPGQLIGQLERWCYQGELRPYWGRWVFRENDELSTTSTPMVEREFDSLQLLALDRFCECLQELQRASQDPIDLLQALLGSLSRVVPSQQSSAWLACDGEWKMVAGNSRNPDFLTWLEEAVQQRRTQQGEGPPSFLALALEDNGEALGGIVVSRSNVFLEAEVDLAERLCLQVKLDLKRARLFGEQNRLLQLTRHRFLTAQIRPHFLFNALNTLAALIPVEPELAESLTLDMAAFLRTTFADRPDRVPLVEEIQLAEVYLRLEKARFGSRLQVDFDIDPEAHSLLLPTLTLQPLLENSVRHGVTQRSGGGKVALIVEPVGEGFLVRIEDNGVGFDPERVRPAGTGVGLSNVRERLQSIYGPDCRWQVDSAPGQGTRISFWVASQ